VQRGSTAVWSSGRHNIVVSEAQTGEKKKNIIIFYAVIEGNMILKWVALI